MREVVIVEAVRSPVGNLGGALKNFTNHGLGEIVLRGLILRARIEASEIQEVIMGCVGQYSDAPNVTRVMALMAGIPKEVPAFTVARNCASGLQALVSASQMILTGDADAVIAGGVEVMSASPYVNRDLRFGKRLRDSSMIDSLWEGLRDPVSGLMMGETAEILAKEFGISRKEQDEYAALSHQRALCAERRNIFHDEIFEIPIPKNLRLKENPQDIFRKDEGPNPSISAKTLASYPPVFRENGTVTSGNACPISDGAAALLVMTREKAVSLGLEPLARIKGYAFSGVEPERMGLGPALSIPAALKKSKVSAKDIQLMEINEAFAAQYLAVEKTLKLKRDIVNPNGGAIALGHPVGATGARLVVTLLHEMKRRDVSLGLVSMCAGGGQGGAMVFERD